MDPSFFDILCQGYGTAIIVLGKQNDDGLPITITSVDGKKHTFIVSDFVNVKRKKTVTHVQYQSEGEALS